MAEQRTREQSSRSRPVQRDLQARAKAQRCHDELEMGHIDGYFVRRGTDGQIYVDAAPDLQMR